MPRFWFLLGPLAGLVLVAGGGGACGGSSPPATPTPPPPPATGPFSVPTDESVANLVEDGRITLAEYEQAVFAYVACLDEHGVPHHEPEFRALRKPPIWVVGIGPYRQDESDDVHRIQANCRGRYLINVAALWALQEAPTEEEVREQHREVVACFNERTGLEVEDFAQLLDMGRSNQFTPEQRYIETGCSQLILEGNNIFWDAD